MDKFLQEIYFTYDDPVPYKSLIIYPVTMRKFIDLSRFSTCFLLDKNSTPDIAVISMTYLEYLFYLHQQGEPYLYFFNLLLALVLRIDEKDISFGLDNGGKPYFSIKDEKFNSEDFNKIRDIICSQNNIKLIDESIQKEIREDMEKAEQYKRQLQHNKTASLEDKMICILISTPLKLEDIYNLTIRKFDKIIQRVDYKLHYQIYLSAQMSGMVEFKDKDALKHWMSDLSDDDEFKDVKVDLDDVKNKIASTGS